MLIDIKNSWINFWNNVNARGEPFSTYNKLVALYSEPHRFYHTLKHISDCLEEFSQARQIPEKPNEVEMAIWFHDAIYDTKSSNNEVESAELADQISKEIKLPEAFASKVHDIILATNHKTVPKDIDTGILLDVDLSILGKNSDKYEKYEKNIRKEYSWVPEEQFSAGRVAIIQGFLGRPYIYSTDSFRKRYEAKARMNLKRSLKRLQT